MRQQEAAPRRIGVWGAAFIAFNGAVGAGIFGLPGKLDEAVGGFAPWLLLLAGGAVMLVALVPRRLAPVRPVGRPPSSTSPKPSDRVRGSRRDADYSSRIAATAATPPCSRICRCLWPSLTRGWSPRPPSRSSRVNLLTFTGLPTGIGLLAMLSWFRSCIGPLVARHRFSSPT